MGVETFEPDNLVVNGPMVEATELVVIKVGQDIIRGTVLGKDADGDYVASTAAGETAKRIAYEAVDATAGDVEAVVFKGGNFNFFALETDGQTAEQISDVLWEQNIHIGTNIGRT